MSLTFDEATHIYRWNGSLVPNVTRVLAPLVDLSRMDPDDLERARHEGVAMHKMVELDVRCELDVSGLPDWLKPRYAAWRKFLAETRFEPIASEQRVYHPTYGYAGTLDLVGAVDGALWLPDIKRSFASGPVIGLQTAAYAAAWESANRPQRIARRFGLRFMASGEYRLEPFDNKADFQTFLALLTVHRWRETNQRRAA